MPAPINEPIGLRSALLALLVSLLWAGNVAALKLGLVVFPPFWNAFWRMLFGIAALLAWAWWRRIPLRPPPAERRRLVQLGLLFAVQIALLNAGADLTSPAYAVVLINAHPIFANIFGHFAAHEQRLGGVRLAGLTLAFAGMCVLVLGKPAVALAPNPLLGNAMLAVSAALLGLRGVYTRQLVQGIDPVRALTWQCLVSTAVFLIAAALFEPMLLGPPTPIAVGGLAYQGIIVAGFCFVVWTELLRRHSAGTLSMFAFTIPFFGVLVSAAIFGEAVTPRIILSGAMVTLGIGIVTRRS
ncbi:MAG: DMT family transporter [Bryobacterales bacterium]|nr:DMT family transporter [Bryobacterales bacterium]